MKHYKAILTDIEGTTSSISFVKDVLFPYAASNLPDYVTQHKHDQAVQVILADAATLAKINSNDTQAIVAQLLTWIQEDQKVTPLKQLQGLIWEAGYKNADFQAHMYADATEKLRSWHAQGVPLYVYSSGSVYAQKLFFGHTINGDLLPLFSGHFDTTIGGKKSVESYVLIANELDLAPSDIVFLTDIVEEYQAAKEAGLGVYLLDRAKCLGDYENKIHSFSVLPF